MAWELSYRYPFLRYGGPKSSVRPFGINEHCFIRKEHECGKIYGASKSCFIASPTHDDLEPILELMSEKLAKVGVEPIIAVKERAYGQDIFCTKICGRIIESRFCVVILDDTITTAVNVPNPNVYYEYGLMTSLRKHIIPLQRDGLELAFNIQSYDTIKYSHKNIASELDRAIRDALRITEAEETDDRKPYVSDKTILRRLELAGLQAKGDKWFLSGVIDDTQLKGFGHPENRFYVYLGKIDEPSECQDYLEDVDVAIYRTEKKADELQQRIQALSQRRDDLIGSRELPPTELPGMPEHKRPRDPYVGRELHNIESEMEQSKVNLENMATIFIGFIIAPQVESADFVKKVEDLVGQGSRFRVACSSGNELWLDDVYVNLLT